jgi:hypothetical protein
LGTTLPKIIFNRSPSFSQVFFACSLTSNGCISLGAVSVGVAVSLISNFSSSSKLESESNSLSNFFVLVFLFFFLLAPSWRASFSETPLALFLIFCFLAKGIKKNLVFSCFLTFALLASQ